MRVLYVVFIMCVYSLLVAQEVEKEIIIKKAGDKTEDVNVWVEKEKLVTVDVTKNGESNRKIKIVMDSDGDETVYEWSDEGEIPADVKEKLEKAGVDLQILNVPEGASKEEKMIEIEWDGDGEMPEELKMFKEKHGVDLSEYLSEDEMAGKKKVVMIEKHMTESEGGPTIRKRTKKGQRYKTVTIDADGNQNVMEWVEDGKSKGMQKAHKMRMHAPQGEMIFISDEDVQVSDAYMGAQIESSDNGAVVLDMMKDSPADKAKLEKGDVITKINGARTRSMDGLLSLLNHFEPNDKVELTILRDGKEKTLKMTLGERPGYFR